MVFKYKIKRSFLVIALFCLLFEIKSHGISEEEIKQTVDEKIITCGSSVRIQNVMTKFK